METKLSVVIAVLDSHEVVKRQLLHFQKMKLSDEEVEFIIVDDGSDPPLVDWLVENMAEPDINLSIIETNDKRPWSQPCARNRGGFSANSEKLLMTDIDHILSREAIKFCIESDADKIMFPRYWGVLDHRGGVIQSPHTLNRFGLSMSLYEKRGLSAGMHHNTFMMKKSLFCELDGYDESFCGKYGGDDTNFSDRYSKLVRVDKKAKAHVLGPGIFVYPDPNKDVLKVFHGLRR